MLEQAAVDQHQVVAGPGPVGGSGLPRPRRVQEAERVQGHAAAAPAVTTWARRVAWAGGCMVVPRGCRISQLRLRDRV